MSRETRISLCLLSALSILALNTIFLIFIYHPPYNNSLNKDENILLSEPFLADTLYMETAAHISSSEFPEYTLIWFDEITDRALYIKNDYKPKTFIPIGSIVTFGEYHGLVTDFDEQGIIIEIQEVNAGHGMSGTAVAYNGVNFGFISRALSTRDVYVVFY